jgi:hypothetical protein
MKEYKIGEVFEQNGEYFEVIEHKRKIITRHDSCDICGMNEICKKFACCWNERSDNKDVYFVKYTPKEKGEFVYVVYDDNSIVFRISKYFKRYRFTVFFHDLNLAKIYQQKRNEMLIEDLKAEIAEKTEKLNELKSLGYEI